MGKVPSFGSTFVLCQDCHTAASPAHTQYEEVLSERVATKGF